MALLESWPERVLTMQRNWIGRSEGAEVVFRVEELGDRAARLHDPSRHALRRDVLRARAGAPARRASSSRAPSARRRCSTTSRHAAARVRRRARRRRARRRRASSPAVRDEPGQRRAHPDLGRRLRADGVRHGRDHGRARPRRARLRVRASDSGCEVRTGRRAARDGSSGRSCRTLDKTERRALGELRRSSPACRRPRR